MTHKHTSGRFHASSMTMNKTNWAALNSGKHPIDVVLRGSDVVAVVWCGDDEDGEEQANARLFSAAPDLLDALLTFPGFTDDATVGDAWVDKMHAAIAKATGQ